MQNGLLWDLPEIQTSLILAIQNLHKFFIDGKSKKLKSIQALQNQSSSIAIDKSFLYKAHHYIQISTNRLQNNLFIPQDYVSIILNSIENLEESDANYNAVPYIQKCLHALIEYANHVADMDQDKKSIYALGLYQHYVNLAQEMQLSDIIIAQKFIFNSLPDQKLSMLEFEKSFQSFFDIGEYYAKYDYSSLQEITENINELKNNWSEPNIAINIAKTIGVIIKEIKWDELIIINNAIEEYLINQLGTADLEIASALLFLEYIVQQPWRRHEICIPNTPYTLEQICLALSQNMRPGEEYRIVDINYVHQKVHGHAIKKAVIKQIDNMIFDCMQNVKNKELEAINIIEQISSVLQTIGFNDTGLLLVQIKNKLNVKNFNLNSNEDIAYINYLLSNLSQYISNNYPKDSKHEIQQSINNKITINDHEIHSNSENIQDLQNANNIEDENNNLLLSAFYQEHTELIKNINLIVNNLNSELKNLNFSNDDLLNLRRYFHNLKTAYRVIDFTHEAKLSGSIEQIINCYLNNEDINAEVVVKCVTLAAHAFSGVCIEYYLYKDIKNENKQKQEQKIADVQNLCNMYLPILPSIGLTHNTKDDISSNAYQINSNTFNANSQLQSNLIEIYCQEIAFNINAVLEIINKLDDAQDIENIKQIRNILHTIAGSSSTVNCCAIITWCDYVSKYFNQNLTNDKFAATKGLLIYTLYDAKDIISHITLEKISQPLNLSSITLLEQIISSDSNLITHDIKDIKDIKANLANTQSYNLPQQNEGDNELINLFLEEGQNLHAIVEQNLITIYSNNASQQEILRALHTLKGGARMVDLKDLGNMYHNMEESAIAKKNIEVLQEEFAAITQVFNSIDSRVTKHNLNLSEDIKANTNDKITDSFNIEPSWFIKVDNQKLSQFTEKIHYIDGYVSNLNNQIKDLLNQVNSTLQTLHKMNQMFNQLSLQEHKRQQKDIGNDSSNSSLNSEFNLHALNFSNGGDFFNSIKPETVLEKPSVQNTDYDLDSLEFDIFSGLQISVNQGQNLTNSMIAQQEYILESIRSMIEQISNLQGHTYDFQQDLSHLSLMSFTEIIARLNQTCMQNSKEQKKKIKLHIQGESIKVSKTILETVSFVFGHLIRNSIVHGIESEEIRLDRKKEATGNIYIKISQQAHNMNITFYDDGQGVDVNKVKQKAIEHNWIDKNTQLNDDEILQLILRPNFSTVSHVSHSSGRGIGLDAVVAYVGKIGGSVSIHNRPLQGFSIRISCPMKYFIGNVIICQIKEYTFGLMMHSIPTILDANLSIDNLSGISILMSSLLDNASHNLHEIKDYKNTEAFIKINIKKITYNIGVDKILSYTALYIKKHTLSYSNPSLIGISVNNIYDSVPVYNLEELINQYLKTSQSGTLVEKINPFNDSEYHTIDKYTKSTSLIMVVDDSATIRQTTQRILKKNQYNVILAIDGVEALEQLEIIQTVDLFLVDIEMPRMDGFELIRNLRLIPRYKNTPIIMISSRQTERHQEKAYALGANDFLAKPYQTQQLISHIVREITKAQNINSRKITAEYKNNTIVEAQL